MPGDDGSRKLDPASFSWPLNYAAANDGEVGIVGIRKWECGRRNVKQRALGGAQSVQKVEDKRITTERHGATRKGTVYKFVASVKFREDPW
jgi:hypothetical protein